ncbi:MAG: FecR domain-containing protein, partial [Candidatus Rokuibacteriota bacterium]
MRRRAWMAAVAALSASLLPPPVAAQTPDPVGVVTTLDGRVTVARAALPAPLVLKFKDDVFGRDRIRTQENALVRVLLGGKAILTVRELSQVTISEEPGRAVVTLPDGKVVLSVAKQRMQPGESIEIRTPNAVAAVRGSILAVAHSAALGTTTAICASGTCTYQFGTGPTGPLPVGQRALNAQMAQASAAEVTEAVTVQTGTREFTSPEEGFQTALLESQTAQATQVAQFVSTGAVGPLPPTGTGLPSLTPANAAPVNSTSTDPLTPGDVPGDTSGPKPGGGEKIVKGGFESNSLPPDWTLSGGGGILTSFGSITPPEGHRMALIHTGPGALTVSANPALFPGAPTNVTQGSRLSQAFNVEGGSLFTIKVNYNFISNEFPDQFVDDVFRVRVTDHSGATNQLAFESRLTSSFQSSSEVVSALGFSTPDPSSGSHGRTGFKALATQWVPETSGSATLSFDIFDRLDQRFNSGALIDAASVVQDPPLHFLRRGDVLTRSQT